LSAPSLICFVEKKKKKTYADGSAQNE
jgi:hypothetical protein